MEEVITRYLIKVKKYVSGENGKSILIGEDFIETDSSTTSTFPNSELFANNTKFNVTLEFVEKRKYKKSHSNPGMIERI